MRTQNRIIQIVDLFCGGGGFTKGCIDAGHKPILCVDNWDKAIQFHEFNFPDIPILNFELGGDIQEAANIFEKYISRDQHLHIHGSPPCQQLSNASNHNSNDGYKMVKWFLNLVKFMKPNSWSMENVLPVSSFLDKDGIPYVKLNAADFGVPQTRKRIFAGQGWHAKETHSKENWVSIIEALPGLEGELNEIVNSKIRKKTINEPIRTITSQTAYQTRMVSRRKKQNEQPQSYNLNSSPHCITQIPHIIEITRFKINRKVGTLNKTGRILKPIYRKLDQPINTILTHQNDFGIFLNNDGNNLSSSKRAVSVDTSINLPNKTITNGNPMLRKKENNEFTKIRSLTPSETLVLQSWNNAKIPKMSKSNLHTIIGNMVCPLVSKAIIEGIQLNNKIDYDRTFNTMKFKQIKLF